MAEVKPLVAGNWKMNGTAADLRELDGIVAGQSGVACDLAVCPPVTLLAEAVRRVEGSDVLVGAQDCHPETAGAHTGEVSAEMIADSGAKIVITGHSERRADHGESDELVRSKTEAAWRAGLSAILCIGETGEERRAGRTETRLEQQLAGSVPDHASAERLVIAYEPMWAIGTGLTPSDDDIGAAHAHIRGRLEARFGVAAQGVRILYGGSVKPANARAILALAGVDGALVGGASLKADDFLAIAAAC